MHRALLLPEIVQAVIKAGKTESGLLYNCLFVNKTFFHEACRILWKGCYGGFYVGHVSPSICDLGRMVANAEIGRDRAQIYADHIRVLVFRDVGFLGASVNGNSRPGGHFGEDAQWHQQLCQLEFPRLEDLNIGKSRSAQKLNTESAILHYVHYGLRDLRVDASASLSDNFLDEISRLCPLLQQLDMDFQNVTISENGLARFLKQMHHLQGIHIAALDTSWSVASFAAVAKYERLQLLHVPSIHDAWFDDIDHSPSFPVLKQLYTLGTSGKALLRLLPASPGLEVIHLYNDNLQGPEDVLSAASNFHLLKNFIYQPNFSTAISGRDLAMLARECPTLTTLAIGHVNTFSSSFGDGTLLNPLLVDIDDEVVYFAARNLASLKHLQLIGRYESYPSLSAVMSAFNQHCPLLETLEISCGPDWHTWGKASSQRWSFVHLKTLILNPSVHMDDALTVMEFQALLQHFKSVARVWFAEMECFNILEADDREQEFNDFMYEAACERDNSIDEEENEW